MKLLFILIGLAVLVGQAYSSGKHAGYDQAVKDIQPTIKTTDKQCVAWLFEANMKDVKKRMCK